MTLEDLAARVDRNGSSRADYQVIDVLRNEVIPRFFGDIDTAVGDMFWRRMANEAIAIGPGINRYPLPKDFRVMASVGIRGAGCALQYIGNDARMMQRYAAVQAQDVRSAPTAYWVEMPVVPIDDIGDPLLYQYELVLSTRPDALYALDLVYYTTPDLREKSDMVELDKYIPFEYQHALISLARADLYGDRHGGDDPMVSREMTIYNNWLAGLKSKKSAGRQQVPRFAW
jgi:hypothetical protein